MNHRRAALLLLFCLVPFVARSQSILITNAQIYDGSAASPFKGDLRIKGDTITEIGPKLKKTAGDTLVDARGLALAPGFIDMHSHADDGIFERSHDAVIRQGITTVLVGQDGGSIFPLNNFFAKLEKNPPSMNVASMAGHATLRQQVIGKDLLHAASAEQIETMSNLLHDEMQAGAMGLSTGLEYDAAHFASTDELIQLASVAREHGGFFNSHVRDEGDEAFKSFDEIIEIGRRARIPVVITHIKLGTTPVWRQAATKMPAVFAKAKAEGVDLKADVYPYTYWQSTLRVIVLDRDYYNAEKVNKAIAENGGAARIRVTRYQPDPSLEGKTLEEIATKWKLTPSGAFMRIVKETLPSGDFKGAEEQVIVESMHEDDLKWFIADPRIMFSTDGQLEGRHPRGAGSFPRVLGRYVREQKVLPLKVAIHKMTALPAAQLGLVDRGTIAPGMKADLVLFDPNTVMDRATVAEPLAPPAGISGVMVNGQWVVKDGKPTGVRPGKVLRHPQRKASGRIKFATMITLRLTQDTYNHL